MKWGKIRLGVEKILALMYADNIVLLVDDEGSMKNMLREVERLFGSI